VALAREEPVVLVLDDLQWAEPTFLRLVDALATAPAPLLLLCLARSEIAEHPDWSGSRGERAVVALGPLADGDAASLVDDALGRGLDRRLRARLVETAGGNPLFLEELCEMLIDTGLVRRVEGGWVPSGEMPEIPLPLTLDALLASRVDLLGAHERAVIECAAVEGRAFTRDAVLTLSPPAAREGVDGALQALVERDLVRATSAGGLPGYRFHHQLIRDVVYRSIPKAQRARSHEQLATWLERDAPTRAAELAEIAGYHLEQAWACRRELGAPPEQSRGLASRGAARLETAASRALTRGDVFAAIKLLRRAVALLADDEPRRARLLADLGAALTEAGRLSEAREALDGARAAARRLGDDALAARTQVEELILELQVDPERSIAAAPPVIRDAAAAFERAGDDLGSCRLAYLEALVHWFQGRAAAAEAAWERAAGHARRLGDAHRLSDIVRWIPSAALWGPSPAEEGIRRCELLLLEQLGRSRQARAEAQGALAGLYAMTGRFERAAELVQESDAIFDEVGFTLHATPEWSAFVAMLAGDAASAEGRLRAGYVRLEQMGERAFLSTTAALLARALLALGDEREALAFTETSERTAAPADLVTQIAWRGTRARILAARGQTAAAERLAREAVELAARTDLLCDHGDALLDLAAVLRAEDRPQDAAGAAHQALELYERKGNLVSADRARSLLHEIAPP
jgi:tetratricopeptide (TPR) repeat protein